MCDNKDEERSLIAEGYSDGIAHAVEVINDRKEWFGVSGTKSLEDYSDFLIREIKK